MTGGAPPTWGVPFFVLTGKKGLFILAWFSEELLRPGLIPEGKALQQVQKRARQRRLLKLLEANPLMTDEDLARSLSVSVSTVRLDRALLNVPELRERMREMAEKASGPLSAMKRASLFGELLGLEPGQWGLSLLVPDSEMVSAEDGAIGGHYLFAQAATLALASVRPGPASIESARVRFLRSVFPLERCIARSKVGTRKNGRSVVSVRTRVMDEDVFVARFILMTEFEEPESRAGGKGIAHSG